MCLLSAVCCLPFVGRAGRPVILLSVFVRLNARFGAVAFTVLRAPREAPAGRKADGHVIAA